jgi:hypothetical protein
MRGCLLQELFGIAWQYSCLVEINWQEKRHDSSNNIVMLLLLLSYKHAHNSVACMLGSSTNCFAASLHAHMQVG